MADKQMVTLAQLQAVCTTQKGRDACGQYLAPLNAAMQLRGINTPARITAFLAQIAHESGEFRSVSESLNYRDYIMADIWPRRYAEPDGKGGYVKFLVEGKPHNKPNALALKLAGKPEAIANNVYANRFGNGPEESGDGWRYRGAGLKQLTFKANHEEFGKAIGLQLALVPDYLRLPEGAALSAAWFWESRGLNKLADSFDYEAITKRINGGLIGQASRLMYLERAKKAFPL